jgi:hypothetical protein
MKSTDNLDLKRAINLLDSQINDPGYLIQFWRFAGQYSGEVPWPERCDPWWDGIGEYFKK